LSALTPDAKDMDRIRKTIENASSWGIGSGRDVPTIRGAWCWNRKERIRSFLSSSARENAPTAIRSICKNFPF
jgi:hypothetical protein